MATVGVDGAATITVTSPAFRDGEQIPARYRGRLVGLNLSPPLAWSGVPADAVELVLVVEDADAPRRLPAVHALVAGIDPIVDAAPEGALWQPSPLVGAVFGRSLLGLRGYVGPMPLRAHGPHRYFIELFALDRALGLEPGFRRAALIEAMRGHVRGFGVVVGTYER